MKALFSLVLIFISIALFSQNENNIWFFGGNAAVSFNSTPPSTGSGMLNTEEGCASVCDASGSLLFYTDGVTIWDSNHDEMETGLDGHESSTHSAIIVPKPGSTRFYYIFTTECGGYEFMQNQELKYSIVDMNLRSGLGDVISSSKNTLLHDEIAEKVAAVRHGNQQDYWIVAHGYDNNKWYSYRLTSTGIVNEASPIESTSGASHGSGMGAIGCMKLSPQGDKVAVAETNSGFYQLLDFDDCTGEVGSAVWGLGSTMAYGLEFSPNGEYLYFSEKDGNRSHIMCLDIASSTVAEIAYTPFGAASNLAAMQIAPDGNIYCARNTVNFSGIITAGGQYLGLISNPNSGSGSSYTHDGLDLGMRYALAGLPTLVTAFVNPPISINVADTCWNDNTDFWITNPPSNNVDWDFGDGNTQTDIDPTVHVNNIYATPGTYTVTLKVYDNCDFTEYTRDIEIIDVEAVDQDITLCGTSANNYDLTQLDNQINTGGQPVSWFHDIAHTNAVSPTIVNISDGDTYYAYVTNADCEAIATINFTVGAAITVNPTVNPNPICLGETVNLDANISNAISWDWTDGNSLSATNIGTPTATPDATGTITYTVSLTDDNGCQGTGSVDLLVNTTPIIDDIADQTVCDSYTLPTITGTNLTGNEAYFTETNGGGTALTGNITSTQTIYIYDINGTCSDEESFVVTVNITPEIDEIDDATVCDSYTLPTITGTNLTGNEAYFTETNGGGTELTGNITSTQTIYIYDIDGTCSDVESFLLTVNITPEIDDIADQTVCDSYTLPTITGTNLTGNEAYFTETNGGGTTLTGNITSTQTIYIYDIDGTCSDEESFVVTVNTTPIIDDIADQTVCDSYTLPTITGTNLTGNEAYFTETNGGGTELTGNIISTQTIYIYDVDGTCSDEESFVVTVNITPEIDEIDDVTVCDSYTLPTITGTNLTGNEAFFTEINGGGTELTGNITSTQTIYIYDVDGTCSDEESFELTVNYTEDASFTLTDFCFGANNSATILGTTGGTFAFNPVTSDGSSINATTGEISNEIAGTTYTVEYTTHGACPSNSTQNITVFDLPIADAGLPSTICSGLEAVIDASASTGANPLTYNWDNSLGAGVSHNVTPVGTTLYTVTVTDANNCTSTDNVEVLVNSSLSVTITPNLPEICLGESVELVANNSVVGVSFEWNTTETTQSIIVAPSLTSTYYVTVSASSCSGEAEVTVTVNTNPNPTIGGNNPFCTGNTIDLDAGAGYDGYLWTDGSTDRILTIGHGGDYDVMVTDGNGCVGNDTTTAIQNNNPTPNISGATSFCTGNSVILDAGAGYSGYVWTPSGNTQTFEVTTGGDYSVTVIDSNGCIGTDNISVTENPNPSPIITGNVPFCTGESIMLSAGFQYASYAWSPNGSDPTKNVTTGGNYSVTVTSTEGCTGTDNVVVVENPNPLPVIQVSGDPCITDPFVLDAGIFESYNWNMGYTTQTTNVSTSGTYSVTVSNEFGCTGTDSEEIIITSPIQTNLPPDFVFCNHNNLLTPSISGGLAPYSYQWSTGERSSTIQYQTEHTMSYTVTVYDNNNCESQDEITISIENIVLEAFLNTDSVCPGDPVEITTNTRGGTAPFTFYENGEITDYPVTIYPTSQIGYTLKVVDACNRTDEKSVIINTYPLPPAGFTANVLSGCEPLTVNFNNSNSCSNCSYVWNFDDYDAISNEANSFHTFETAGEYDISLEVINNYGCKNSLSYEEMINVFEMPEARFETDIVEVDILHPYFDFFNTSIDADNYVWDFKDGSKSFNENPSHEFNQAGEYNVELVAVTNHGCIDTTTQIVVVNDKLTFYAPTAFTPNRYGGGNGINDMFFVFGNGIVEDGFKLMIFDRWGEPIFESKSLYVGWDGKAKNKDLVKTDTYTWICMFKDFKGNKHERSGAVTVIR